MGHRKKRAGPRLGGSSTSVVLYWFRHTHYTSSEARPLTRVTRSVNIDSKTLEELAIALGRDRFGQFPLRRLLDEIFLRHKDMLTPRESSIAHGGGAGMEPLPESIIARPALSFKGRDEESGALEREAQDIVRVQDAMVLLYAVINPERCASSRNISLSVEIVRVYGRTTAPVIPQHWSVVTAALVTSLAAHAARVLCHIG